MLSATSYSAIAAILAVANAQGAYPVYATPSSAVALPLALNTSTVAVAPLATSTAAASASASAAAVCLANYDTCRVAYDANFAACAAQYAACLGYNPFTTSAAALPIASSSAAVAPVFTTEVVTALTTYCPFATEIPIGHTTYTITEATTLTITDCPCTITRTHHPAAATPVPVAPTTAAVHSKVTVPVVAPPKAAATTPAAAPSKATPVDCAVSQIVDGQPQAPAGCTASATRIPITHATVLVSTVGHNATRTAARPVYTGAAVKEYGSLAAVAGAAAVALLF